MTSSRNGKIKIPASYLSPTPVQSLISNASYTSDTTHSSRLSLPSLHSSTLSSSCSSNEKYHDHFTRSSSSIGDIFSVYSPAERTTISDLTCDEIFSSSSRSSISTLSTTSSHKDNLNAFSISSSVTADKIDGPTKQIKIDVSADGNCGLMKEQIVLMIGIAFVKNEHATSTSHGQHFSDRCRCVQVEKDTSLKVFTVCLKIEESICEAGRHICEDCSSKHFLNCISSFLGNDKEIKYLIIDHHHCPGDYLRDFVCKKDFYIKVLPFLAR